MSSAPYDNPSAHVIRQEVVVPGTPEQVWDAIATSQGISAVFCPTDLDPREGGEIVAHLGPGFDSHGTVTAYEAPHRFGYVVPTGPPGAPEGAPPWATEFLVEARDGGTCVVRIVSGYFENGEGWEETLSGMDRGWRNGLNNLRLYLAHFAGRPLTGHVALMNFVGAEQEAVRAALHDALGLTGTKPGDTWSAPEGMPHLEGVVEQNDQDGVMLRTHVPGPGLWEVSTGHGEQTMVAVWGFFYGDDTEALEQARKDLEGFVKERLPELVAD